jgi:hypothetical protein
MRRIASVLGDRLDFVPPSAETVVTHVGQRRQMTPGRRLCDCSTVRNHPGERGLGRRIDDGRNAVERRRVFLPLRDDRFVDVSIPGLR